MAARTSATIPERSSMTRKAQFKDSIGNSFVQSAMLLENSLLTANAIVEAIRIETVDLIKG